MAREKSYFANWLLMLGHMSRGRLLLGDGIGARHESFFPIFPRYTC